MPYKFSYPFTTLAKAKLLLNPKSMKNLFILLFPILFIFSCTTGEKELVINIENPSNFDRTTQLVEIPIEKVKEKVTIEDTQNYIVKNEKGEIIPSQITSDGKLIFESNLKAKQVSTFSITSGDPQQFDAKTYGRFITERKDDFAWENDKVAFRVYGPALIPVDGPSNGIDVWFKRTPNMVIDKWYKDDIAGIASYHSDHGEGLDDYKVGRTLGAGGMAPYVKGKLWLNENFAAHQVLDNGPLRTTIKLSYKNIAVDGKEYAETRTFSIDAGSQLSKVIQEYTTDNIIPVAAAIVKRAESDSIIVASDKSYVIYDEPKNESVGDVYIAVVFPQGIDSTKIDTYTIINERSKKEETYSHVLAIATYLPNTPITYYTGYGWSKYGFPTDRDFQKYLETFVSSIREPFIIKYQ